MKKSLVVFFLLLFISSIHAQDAAWPVEIFCVTENLPASPIMTFTMTAQSPRWDVISNAPYPPQASYFFLTEDYEVETYIPTANNLGQNSAGFEFVGLANAGFPVIGFGLYKVTNNLNNKYFYLDYRDYRSIYMVWYQPNDSTWQNSIDIWIKYNGQTNTFSHSAKGPSTGFNMIENGQLLNIWDIKQKGAPLTNLFPDYWDNCLAVIDNGSSKPRLVWGPYPDQDISVYYYKIYKKKNSPNFTLYDSTTAANYVDTQETLLYGPPVANETVAKYKITAVGYLRSSQIETDYTNEVEARIAGSAQDKLSVKSNNQITENYLLSQNYPNPFNPTTQIRYQIPESGNVQIKVFDVLGRELSILVDEFKETGKFTIDFKAANLPSGVYIYKLISGGFVQSKKMLLLR